MNSNEKNIVTTSNTHDHIYVLLECVTKLLVAKAKETSDTRYITASNCVFTAKHILEDKYGLQK